MNSYSGSNLRRALGIMYHHVIHDSSPEIFQNISISVDLDPRLVLFPGFCIFLYGIGTGLEKIITEKSLGIGLEKFWYRKSLGIGLKKIWYRKKVSESISFRFWVSSHTGTKMAISTLIPAQTCAERFESCVTM
jgi:hypothetical protein